MRNVSFETQGFQEFTDWAVTDKNIFRKIVKLLDECRKHPFDGTGKPEALKHSFKGLWSRRITLEHRLIYSVTDDTICVISCKSHYQ